MNHAPTSFIMPQDNQATTLQPNMEDNQPTTLQSNIETNKESGSCNINQEDNAAFPIPLEL
ncbi:hypothetical protein ACH5RR_037017, partial [Cinchona calisaya]